METFVITAAVGVVVGILSGLLGIGGGTLMVPLFRLGFGLSALASTATSLFTIIPTSLMGFITHIKNKTCIPQLGIVCGLAGACTSPLGVHLANMSPAWMVMLAAGNYHWLFIVQDVPQGCAHAKEPCFGQGHGRRRGKSGR